MELPACQRLTATGERANRQLADRPRASVEVVLYPERWAVEALVGLWEANRTDGEPYGDCFARLGVPRYATLLDQVMNPAA